MSERDYQAIYRASWDERAPAHAASPGYAFDQFVADPAFLSRVVRFDRQRLGGDGPHAKHNLIDATRRDAQALRQTIL